MTTFYDHDGRETDIGDHVILIRGRHKREGMVLNVTPRHPDAKDQHNVYVERPGREPYHWLSGNVVKIDD